VRKKSKLYQEIVESAKIADNSIVFFWEKMLDIEEAQQEHLRSNDHERFIEAAKQKAMLIERITWEENQIKLLENKLKNLE
jgi:hypothetical protein